MIGLWWTKDYKLDGCWKRTGDEFQGCVVRIERVEAGLVGRLIVLPKAMADYGWKEGDLKWHGITRAGRNKYHLHDARKSYDKAVGKVVGVDYLKFDVTAGRNTLRFYDPSAPLFWQQKWVRSK